MKSLAIAVISSLCLANAAFAQSATDCESKAVSKEGKPLHGAAKTAFMKKCEKGNPPPAKAEGKSDDKADGKTAQQEKMKKCNADAAGKKGDERKQFMSACLSNK